MGNNLNIGKAENSNVVGGNVSGNVTTKISNIPNENNIKSVDVVKKLEKSSSKVGIVLATIFVLALIVLFVLTR